MRRFVLLLAITTSCGGTVETGSSMGGNGTSTTSAGGAGGAGGVTATTMVCNKEPAFMGSSECFDSSAACCELDGVVPEKVCYVKTLGSYLAPVFCDVVPNLGTAETDNRPCEVASDAVYSCTWGSGTLICCE